MSDDVFQMPTTEEIETGGYVPIEEGTYLVALGDVERDPMGKNGALREGLSFRFQILCGTVPGQENLEHRELFRWASYPSSDNGNFFGRRLAWIASALDVIDPRKMGGKQVDPHEFFPSLAWEEAIGKVCFIKLKKSKNEKYREIDRLEIYHVHSPKAADFPRDEEIIAQAGMRAWANGESQAKSGIGEPESEDANNDSAESDDPYGDLT